MNTTIDRMIGTVEVDGHRFPTMSPDVRMKRTDELVPGDVVLLPSRVVRTVSQIVPAGYVNSRNEEILTVWYAEGSTPEWSGGNTGAPESRWKVAV